MRRERFHAWAIRCLLAVTLTTRANAGDRATADVSSLRARALEVLEPLPAKMPGTEDDTRAMVKLGKKLYLDKRLSVKKNISCNSCHSLQSGGSYGRLTFGNTRPVKHGRRDTPTVLNAGLHIAQFWDGRSPDLEAQAKEPMLNPNEMAMPAEAELLKRLEAVASYRNKFARAFPDDSEPISIENATVAIAAFERTLISRDRFDNFLNGKDWALSRKERRGLELFLDNNCQKCHDGQTLGGSSFQKIGIKKPYANTNDLGRAEFTKKEEDRFKFKVPSLRNVGLTAPYFHDGKVATLEEAIRLMGYLQLDKQLSDAEVRFIVAFLRTLSDKELVRKNSP